MAVDIISTERIKPSLPTPDHQKSFNLCLLDHLIPAAYAPIVIFYPNNRDFTTPGEILERLDLLKGSLSETLTLFFPLAGTIRDDACVDCDDQGACFTTAKVKSSMSEFLGSPDLKILLQFLPCGLNSIEPCVTNVQASVFTCGGIAVGLCISHRILDGAALSTFLKAWANAARSSKDGVISPDHISASSLFPVDGSWLKEASTAMWGCLLRKGQFVTKRFVFNGAAIASLRGKAATGDTGSSPTRVEAVSSFIWKHAMAAASEEMLGFKKPSLMTHMVNLRKRAVPNLSGQSLGNLVWIASAKCAADEKGSLELPALVDKVRRCIARIDNEYVEKLRGDGGRNVMTKDLAEIGEFGKGSVDYIGFTSWCKLGFYDVDFGWGKPVWVSSIDSSGPFFMNLVVLMDTRFGDGIEAWMTLEEQQMTIFEHNQEFTSFAVLNPSPLHTA